MPKNSNYRKRRAAARAGRGRQRRLSVRSELRDTPDTGKIARVVVALAIAQAEAEAAQQKGKGEAADSPGGKGDHA